MPTKSKKQKSPKRNNMSKQMSALSRTVKTLAMSNGRKQVKKLAKRATKALLPKLGAAAASAVGIPRELGTRAGNYVANHVNRLIGSGDYTLYTPATNSLIKGSGGTAPTFNPRRTRITHREYICDISTASTVGGFKVSQLVCNPSDPYTFPFVSQIAALYEKYKFHGLVFEFVSTVGQYSAGALGSVIMTSLMNCSTAQFVNKTQMENTEEAISFRTDTNGLYGVECKDMVQNWYYTKHLGATVRPNSNVANIYDVADFSIATFGGTIAANTIIGELWVSFDVEFEGPRMPDQRTGYYHAYSTSGTNSAPLTGATVAQFGSLNAVTITTNNTINFNNVIIGDIYLVTITANGPTSETPYLSLVGCDSINLWNNETNSSFVLSGTAIVFLTTVRITSVGATMGVSIGTTAASETYVDVIITPISFAVNTGL